jgi:hypothetical protein
MTDDGPMKTAGNYRIQIYGPKEDGTYVIEFRTDGQVFALSTPRTETEVIRRFKERMPGGVPSKAADSFLLAGRRRRLAGLIALDRWLGRGFQSLAH